MDKSIGDRGRAAPIGEARGGRINLAEHYRRYGHFDEARTLWRDIVSNHGAHTLAEYAAELVAELESFMVK